MKKVYSVIHITRRYAGRTTITHEKPVVRLDSFPALISWASAHGATSEDLDELTDDIESMGVGGWHNYRAEEYTVK